MSVKTHRRLQRALNIFVALKMMAVGMMVVRESLPTCVFAFAVSGIYAIPTLAEVFS